MKKRVASISPRNKKDYVEEFQERLIEQFLAVLATKNNGKDRANRLRKVLNARLSDDRNERVKLYDEIESGLTKEELLELHHDDAKICDICRVARVTATTNIVEAHQEKANKARRPLTADTFEYVIKKFHDAGLSADEVKKLINENAKARSSDTGHPTGVESNKFSEDIIKLSAIMSGNASANNLRETLSSVIDKPLIGEKKTVLDEVAETIMILHVKYDNAYRAHKELRAALDKYGYKDVVIKEPIVDACTWRPGDGDGNPNATMEALDDGIKMMRVAVLERYIGDLKEIYRGILEHDKKHPDLNTGGSFQAVGAMIKNLIMTRSSIIASIKDESVFEKLRSSIKKDEEKYILNFFNKNPEKQFSQEDLMVQLDAFKQNLESLDKKNSGNRLISELRTKVDTFGFRYAKSDVRHEANDIMITIGRMSEAAGLIAPNVFDKLSIKDKQEFISNALSSEESIVRLEKLKSSDLKFSSDDKKGTIAERLLGRLQVIGRNPDACEKLIVAECKEPAHALAALLLMKAGGNEVGNKKSRIDLVTLSESPEDLDNLEQTLESLMEEATYLQHIKARGKIVVQIAKSDTVRRGGRGAEGAQDRAIKAAFRLGEKYGIKVEIFIGGGAPVQRGGGRIQENPHNVGRHAIAAGATKMGAVTFTVQGHQRYIVYSPSRAKASMEATASQNLYAAWKVEEAARNASATKAHKRINTLLSKRAPDDMALEGREIECNAEMKAYKEKYVGNVDDKKTHPGNPAFDKLMGQAGYVARNLSNVSSRASVRPTLSDNDAETDAFTPSRIKGDNPKLTSRRSIGVERICAHSGTYLISLLSVLEGLQALNAKGDNALHDTYLNNKSTRDSWRGTAMILAKVDLDIAWEMLIGKERPDDDTIQALAAQFKNPGDEGYNPKNNTPEVTLAWYENYVLNIEKLLHKGILGRELDDKNVVLGATLKAKWPDVASQTEFSHRLGEFSNRKEATLTDFMNKNPNMPLTEYLIELLRLVYAGADMGTNTPVGAVTTLTRESMRSKVNGFGGTVVEKGLKLPPCFDVPSRRDGKAA